MSPRAAHLDSSASAGVLQLERDGRRLGGTRARLPCRPCTFSLGLAATLPPRTQTLRDFAPSPLIILATDNVKLIPITAHPNAIHAYAAQCSQVLRLDKFTKHSGGRMYAKAHADVAPTSSKTTPRSQVMSETVMAETTREVVEDDEQASGSRIGRDVGKREYHVNGAGMSGNSNITASSHSQRPSSPRVLKR